MLTSGGNGGLSDIKMSSDSAYGISTSHGALPREAPGPAVVEGASPMTI